MAEILEEFQMVDAMTEYTEEDYQELTSYKVTTQTLKNHVYLKKYRIGSSMLDYKAKYRFKP